MHYGSVFVLYGEARCAISCVTDSNCNELSTYLGLVERRAPVEVVAHLQLALVFTSCLSQADGSVRVVIHVKWRSFNLISRKSCEWIPQKQMEARKESEMSKAHSGHICNRSGGPQRTGREALTRQKGHLHAVRHFEGSSRRADLNSRRVQSVVKGSARWPRSPRRHVRVAQPHPLVSGESKHSPFHSPFEYSYLTLYLTCLTIQFTGDVKQSRCLRLEKRVFLRTCQTCLPKTTSSRHSVLYLLRSSSNPHYLVLNTIFLPGERVTAAEIFIGGQND